MILRLLLTPAWLAIVLSSPSQKPLLPLPLSTTLVDLLAASTEHSLLLQAFQHARLIPVLNSLRYNETTLLAPTDEAIRRENDRHQGKGIWSFTVSNDQSVVRGMEERDNLQLELRETLLYHLFNCSIFETNTTTLRKSNSSLFESLFYPSLSLHNQTYPIPPALPETPPEDPDRPEGLLRGEGQKLKIVETLNGEVWVGVSAEQTGKKMTGYRVIKDSKREATHGALVSIDGVLERPIDLAQQIRTNPSLSILASLLPTKIIDYISTAAHLTLFAPTNEAWSALSDLEFRYLKSGFAELDLSLIFGDTSSTLGQGNNRVGYIDRLTKGNGSSITTILGQTLKITRTDESIFVNSTQLQVMDILANNGVLHLSPSLLLPPGALSLTAEKYLIALNATRFVGLMRSVNLSHFIQIPSNSEGDKSFTILAPRDELLSSGEWDGRWNSVPPEGSLELKELLEYHILEGKRTVDKLRDGQLVATELKSWERDGDRQMLEVSVAKGGVGHNLGFGGANVVETVHVGHSIIYLISTVLDVPAKPLTVAISDLRLSSFVSSVYAAQLDKVMNQAPSLTFLIPTNKAFANLGLVMKYLLLPAARRELRSLIQYHMIDEIVYLDDFPMGSGRFPTLHGSEIMAEKSVNGTIMIHGATIAGKPANGEMRDAEVIDGTALTSSGAIHVINQVELPPDLEITMDKLLRGARALTMLDLVKAAGLNWVLDGSQPPSSSSSSSSHELNWTVKKKKNRRKNKDGSLSYAILAPTDKAFARINLTYYLDNLPALTALVKLHIIPLDAMDPLPLDDGKPLSLSDEISYPTLLDSSQVNGTSEYGTVAFRSWGEDNYLVGIKDARGSDGGDDSARIIAYGRATPQLNEGKWIRGGGVLLIDSVLIPFEPSWFNRVGWIIALIGLGMTLIACVGLLAWKIWKGKQSIEYEALEGQED